MILSLKYYLFKMLVVFKLNSTQTLQDLRSLMLLCCSFGTQKQQMQIQRSHK